jgi:hypothetical protein
MIHFSNGTMSKSRTTDIERRFVPNPQLSLLPLRQQGLVGWRIIGWEV